MRVLGGTIEYFADTCCFWWNYYTSAFYQPATTLQASVVGLFRRMYNLWFTRGYKQHEFTISGDTSLVYRLILSLRATFVGNDSLECMTVLKRALSRKVKASKYHFWSSPVIIHLGKNTIHLLVNLLDRQLIHIFRGDKRSVGFTDHRRNG
jgi:hypothetical protein